MPLPDNRPAAARMQQHFDAMHDDADRLDRRAAFVSLAALVIAFAIVFAAGFGFAALVLL